MEKKYQRAWINISAFFYVLNVFIFYLLAFRLHIDRWSTKETVEKPEVLDVDEHYIGEEFAQCYRNLILNAEGLKDKEWIGAYLQLRNNI